MSTGSGNRRKKTRTRRKNKLQLDPNFKIHPIEVIKEHFKFRKEVLTTKEFCKRNRVESSELKDVLSGKRELNPRLSSVFTDAFFWPADTNLVWENYQQWKQNNE